MTSTYSRPLTSILVPRARRFLVGYKLSRVALGTRMAHLKTISSRFQKISTMGTVSKNCAFGARKNSGIYRYAWTRPGGDQGSNFRMKKRTQKWQENSANLERKWGGGGGGGQRGGYTLFWRRSREKRDFTN